MLASVLRGVLRACTSVCLIASSIQHVGAVASLENPQPASYQSGIGLLSGWSCEGPSIALSIDGGASLGVPYGSSRADTASLCGAGNTNTGFGLLFNFNTLGTGSHTVQLFVSGQAQGGAVTFNVVVPGGEFLSGVERQVAVADFPFAGKTTGLLWQQAQQNFAIRSVAPGASASAPVAARAASPAEADASLENPQPGSYQSGIGLLSGWSCQGPSIAIAIDGASPVGAPYGSSRADTAGLCGAGNTNTGFGLLFNFNTLASGAHTAQLFVNGQPQGSTTQFDVVVPVGEFLTGVAKEVDVGGFPSAEKTTRLIWQQAQQNFAIRSVGSAGSGAEGMWVGKTNTGQSMRAIILDNGNYYILYSSANSVTDAGFILGSSQADAGQFGSADGIDYPYARLTESGDPATSASVAGTFVSRTTLQLVINENSGTRTFSGSYDPAYDQAASLALVAGSYHGITGHVGGKLGASFSIDATGKLSGRNGGCSFVGTVTPRKATSVFDFTVRADQSECIFGFAPISGIMVYDPSMRQVHGLTTFSGRSDLWYLIGAQ